MATAGYLVPKNKVQTGLLLSDAEVRALRILINNYVRGGFNPITAALFAVADALDTVDGEEITRFYGSVDSEGVNFNSETRIFD